MNLGPRWTAILAFLTLSAMVAAQTPVPAVPAEAQSGLVAAQTPAPPGRLFRRRHPVRRMHRLPPAGAHSATTEGDQGISERVVVTVGKS
jgi:hypothetical protein